MKRMSTNTVLTPEKPSVEELLTALECGLSVAKAAAYGIAHEEDHDQADAGARGLYELISLLGAHVQRLNKLPAHVLNFRVRADGKDSTEAA